MLNWIERLFEMSKFKVFLAFWTGLSCCALVYLANRSFKPELSPPKEFISNLNVTRLNSKDIILVRNAWPQILKDLHELRGLFQVLNITKSFQPIELKFSSKNPELFRVGPDSVELGISFALSPGQISHALLQNWYLQNRSVQSNSEKLQQLLFADIFWTAAHASFELGLPDLQNSLRLTNIDFENLRQENILAQIASSDLILASDWAPQEMQSQNISQKHDFLRRPGLINPLSLRKNLLIHFLKFEQGLGLSKRI